MTPTEQDKELDLFSEEALKIAEALRSKYPNTWRLLYNNHVMPEVIAFITADRKRVALEARIAERNKIALDNYRGKTFSESTNWQAMFEYFMDNNEKSIAKLKAQQEEV